MHLIRRSVFTQQLQSKLLFFRSPKCKAFCDPRWFDERPRVFVQWSPNVGHSRILGSGTGLRLFHIHTVRITMNGQTVTMHYLLWSGHPLLPILYIGVGKKRYFKTAWFSWTCKKTDKMTFWSMLGHSISVPLLINIFSRRLLITQFFVPLISYVTTTFSDCIFEETFCTVISMWLVAILLKILFRSQPRMPSGATWKCTPNNMYSYKLSNISNIWKHIFSVFQRCQSRETWIWEAALLERTKLGKSEVRCQG